MYQFGHFLIRNASIAPNRLAFICNDKEYTYRELNDEVNRLANALSALGVKKGDRVAYMFKNCPETVLCFLAMQKLGATALAINTHFLSGEISRIFGVTEIKVVIYDPQFSEVIHESAAIYGNVRTLITTGIPAEGEYNFYDIISNSSTAEAQVELSEDDESVIILTSGTTGTSKAAVRTQKMVREYGLMLAIENDNCHRPEIALTHCPFFHTACLSILIKMLALCGTFVLVSKIDPQNVFDIIESRKVTQMLVVPPLMYMRLYESGLWKSRDLTSLNEAQFTGGKCSKDYIIKICEMFPNAKIRASYGSTETSAPCSMVVTKEELFAHPERMTSVGHINANCELRIVDANMNDVPVGEVGEAIVRSPMLFKGYIKNEELNKKVFTDGWFHTEDLMRRDEYGYYYLVDRSKDMVKTGGENVYAQEVEDILREHPAILDCAIIGVPDKKFEEAVAAAITLEPGMTLTDAELLEYCKKTLPSYKKPRYIQIMDEIPHNVTGKVQKSVLREHKENFRPIEGV